MERLDSIVIGLGHKARNGKDSVAKFIARKYGTANGGPYSIVIMPFAAALKAEVNAAAVKYGGFMGLMTALVTRPREFGLQQAPPEWVKLDADPDMSDPLCPMGKHRKLLQFWGSEFRRAQNPWYWVLRLDAMIRAMQPKPHFVLVTDVRFANEMAWVKAVGGDTVKVTREGFVDVASANHQSETALLGAKFDYEIVCEDNLEELERLSHELFEVIVADHFPPPPDTPFVSTIEINA